MKNLGYEIASGGMKPHKACAEANAKQKSILTRETVIRKLLFQKIFLSHLMKR